jgi:hypothetical protein
VNSMPKNLRVTLDWGFYGDNPDEVPSRAGLYMILAGRMNEKKEGLPESYVLLDIGQSGDSGVRLRGHDREPCWNQKKPANTMVLYKFAAMPSSDYDENDRRIAECCLRSHTRPPCGTECNQGYNRSDSVAITNTGKMLPLREAYSCP